MSDKHSIFMAAGIFAIAIAATTFAADVATPAYAQPEALAAEKALISLKETDAPDAIYGAFNEFARTHFGAETDPLIYEKFGKDLKLVDNGTWKHVSENSASLAWETNLPAGSYVEYGETTSYGKKSDPTDRPYFLHVHQLKDLETGKTYHYRLVATDERGNTLNSPDQTLETKKIDGAIYLKQAAGGAVQKLTKEGTYVLQEDLTVAGGAIVTQRDNITLDLNGHTITFAEGATVAKDSVGILGSGSSKESKVPYTATNLKIFNGTLKQGTSELVESNTDSLAFNAITIGGQDIEIAGLNIIYHAPQSWGVHMHHNAGDIRVHHNVFKDMGARITNRHGLAVRAIGWREMKESPNKFNISNNLIQRTRQNGISQAHTMSHNEVYVDSWSTNSFAIQPESAPGIDAGESVGNKVFATGFNAYGFGWAHENLKVHDNFISMFGLNVKSRWPEDWGDVNLLAAIRVTNYGEGGQVRNNLEYWDNLIIMRGKQGSEVQGARFFSDSTIKGIVFHNNVVKVESLDTQTTRAAAIVPQGHYKKPDCNPVYYRDNRLISNTTIVSFGDSYGKGNNHIFENCSFEKIGASPNFHTFIFDGTFYNRGHMIIDGKFSGGAAVDDVYWAATGSQSNYAIAWTLTVKTAPGAKVSVKDAAGDEAFNGVANGDGVAQMPLVQSVIRPTEWQPQDGDMGRGVQRKDEHQTIAKTPHTVTVTVDGKDIVQTVTMDRAQTVEIK